jgi:hypothetical protein
MVRALSLGLAVVIAWSVQGLSWSRAPASIDRHTLIERFADQVRPGDEVAYLPGWEQGWALALEQRFAGHPQRLGRDDLLRPYARLWLLSSQDAGVYELPQGVRQGQVFEHASMRAVLLQREQRVGPIAWPLLGTCQLSAKRTSCSVAGARVKYGEIGLDGRFAMGFKVKPGKTPMTLTFSLPGGASLVGGLGWTAHGARNGQGRARWQAKGATTQEGVLKRRPGLLPLEVSSDGRGKVTLEFEGLDAKGVELGLSVGWLQ